MTKKLLSFQYPPFYHPNFGLIFFGHLGFDVFRCDIGEYKNLENAEILVKLDHNMSLRDFDAVLIINAEKLEPFHEGLLFPEKVILDLKKRLNEISKEEGKDILLFGVNSSIPPEYHMRQSILFDSMFISAATPEATYTEILEKLRLFAVMP